MSVIKTILVVLYFLIGFIFSGAAIKSMVDQSKWKTTTLLFVALLYVFFWPILFAVGLGMRLMDDK